MKCTTCGSKDHSSINCTAEVKQSNSERGLEMLCQQQPDHPISYGLGKLAMGAGCGAITAGSVWLLGSINEQQIYQPNTEMKVLNVFMNLLVGGAGFASGLGGFYFLADSLTSLAKPFGIYQNDGTVYHRNGGFTNTPTPSDKKFGTRVMPIDNVSDLARISNEKVFLNGFVVKSSSITSREDSRLVYDQTLQMNRLETDTKYTTVVQGEFNEKPLQIYVVTESGGFAENLANQNAGTRLHVVGTVSKDGETTSISLDQYGGAF